MVGVFGDPSIFCMEGIIVDTSFCICSFKAVTNLKTFDCSDGQHCFGKIGVQFFKYSITDSYRHTGNNTFNDAS